VILDGDKILLAQHVAPDRTYWLLPGGAVEPGESAERAAVREVREETGLDIEVVCLLFVDGPRDDGTVRIRSPRYTFLGRVIGGSLRPIEDRAGARGTNGYLACTRWMPFEHDGYDAATRDTLVLVRRSLGGAPAPDAER
jgi:ADP-ribose pyrophosphatase YjhB (NUDIX family)